MRTASIPLALLLPTLLSGCTLFGNAEQEGKTEDPFDARDGPHFLLRVTNTGPYAARIDVRVVGPDAGAGFHDGFDVPPGETREVAVPLAGAGEHRATMGYSWTKDGRAASGQTEARFDSHECAGPVRVAFTVDTTADRTSSGASTACAG